MYRNMQSWGPNSLHLRKTVEPCCSFKFALHQMVVGVSSKI